MFSVFSCCQLELYQRSGYLGKRGTERENKGCGIRDGGHLMCSLQSLGPLSIPSCHKPWTWRKKKTKQKTLTREKNFPLLHAESNTAAHSWKKVFCTQRGNEQATGSVSRSHWEEQSLTTVPHPSLSILLPRHCPRHGARRDNGLCRAAPTDGGDRCGCATPRSTPQPHKRGLQTQRRAPAGSVAGQRNGTAASFGACWPRLASPRVRRVNGRGCRESEQALAHIPSAQSFSVSRSHTRSDCVSHTHVL